MYPSQTSLIPATVALSRFLEEQGFSAFLQNYPFWYLGSTPYRYLTGPVVPLLTAWLHKIITDVSLFDITIWMVIVSYVISVFGWLILINKIRDSRFKIQDSRFKIHNSLFIILLVVFPWRLFSAFTLNEASFTIARNLLPWVLLAFWGRRAVAVLALSLLLLINTRILPIFLVGLVSLALAKSFRKGRFRAVSSNFKKVILFTIYSLLFTIFYYTPGYWWTVITNPSIGGASGIKVIFRIIDLLKASVPLVLAVIAVYFSGRIKSRLSVFSLIWTFTFLFLTAFRFIGDPDFWMDWTSWFSELEIGVALLGAKAIHDLRFMISDKKPPTAYYILLAVLLIPFYLTWRIHLALGKPALISDTIPQGVRSLEKLSEIAGQKRVFLSGSTVFWANALYDIYQVRGGRDQVAVHPTWDKAAYELREGNDPEKSREWLNELDVSYVLVHGPKSYEYYHDFKNINKWSEIGGVVWEGNGDTIYEISARE